MIVNTLENLDTLVERLQVMVSCAGPLQQLVVPQAVLKTCEFDDILTLEVRPASGAADLEVHRVSALLVTTHELYTTLCRIRGTEDSEALRVMHVSGDSELRFDLVGDADVIKSLKELLVDLWVRVRNQDTPHMKDLNKAIATGLAPILTIEQRLQSADITQETANQLRHQLSSLAMSIFDHGVQIREIPDTVDNRSLMEQVRQRRLPQPAEPEELPASESRSAPEKRKSTAKKSDKARRAATKTKQTQAPKRSTRKDVA